MPRERLYVGQILAGSGQRVIRDLDDKEWQIVLRPGQWRPGMSKDEVEQLARDNEAESRNDQ